MADGIEKYLEDSGKAELLERLEEELETADKVIVVLIEDKDGDKYTSQVMMLNIENTYEAYGILEVAKKDLQAED